MGKSLIYLGGGRLTKNKARELYEPIVKKKEISHDPPRPANARLTSPREWPIARGTHLSFSLGLSANA